MRLLLGTQDNSGRKWHGKTFDNSPRLNHTDSQAVVLDDEVNNQHVIIKLASTYLHTCPCYNTRFHQSCQCDCYQHKNGYKTCTDELNRALYGYRIFHFWGFPFAKSAMMHILLMFCQI